MFGSLEQGWQITAHEPTFSLPPIFINAASPDTATPIWLHIAYDGFHAAMTELHTGDRNLVTRNATMLNI